MADLTLQQATTIIDASLRKGRETGCVPLAVTVPDVGGHLKGVRPRRRRAGIAAARLAGDTG
jgi:uncharacterized protein GlcG (DUF336 family)